ncbi:peptidase S9 prolyl oligopeptidase active site domain protein [Salinarchaeum sp. Harcht-Bsk1]|uniref:S9 family peptidase n=1 Tax=Salinarchaeum sp. Harcht-Bsk1 TaxID=1333523 RepID=UPI0003423FA7|nr:S9 family peptidase [Salinarchaeum sp. Harcht-Bsk1]AGN00270.1 peptidase S9 prolyl oligopeptidase active site domain protein [Salinarchaeum sp. Harcht-Bsk1]
MSFSLERYLNVRSAYGASWSPAGDRLAFLLDTTGVPQVWTVDDPGAWPAQHTTFEERVTFVDYSPTREELVFGMDEGGNERAQLHLLDVDGGEIENLTQHPDAKHRWGGWASDGERFAFASNRRDEAVFDLYVQDRDARGEDAELIAEGDGWLSLAGWSPEDDRLLVHEARSSFDHELHLCDVESGDLRQVTDHDDDIRYSSPEWAPDGEGIYLATDEDVDTRSLCYLDLASGEIETFWDGGDWEVDGVVVDEDSDLVVASRNVDGETDLAVGRLAGRTEIDPLPVPDLPGPIAGGVDVAPDGDRFSITATGRSHNANVWVVDVGDGSAAAAADASAAGFGESEAGDAPVERWTAAPTAGIPRETFRDPDLIHYETFDGREIPALFTLPDGAADATADPTDGDGLPVIVDVHGGPESQRRPSFSAVQQYFLARGYALFEPNVRGSTGYGREYTHLDDVENRMDSVADLAAAHDWLAERPAIDPDRIVVKGGSYGGFMVLAAMTEYPDLWAAGVDVVGIANFVTFLENTGDWRRELREAEYGSLEDDRELLERISPINSIDEIEAPLFVAHGANDPRVPLGEAEQVADAAREQGVPVELLVFDDEGHGFSKLENRIESTERIAAFLDEHV